MTTKCREILVRHALAALGCASLLLSACANDESAGPSPALKINASAYSGESQYYFCDDSDKVDASPVFAGAMYDPKHILGPGCELCDRKSPDRYWSYVCKEGLRSDWLYWQIDDTKMASEVSRNGNRQWTVRPFFARRSNPRNDDGTPFTGASFKIPNNYLYTDGESAYGWFYLPDLAGVLFMPSEFDSGAPLIDEFSFNNIHFYLTGLNHRDYSFEARSVCQQNIEIDYESGQEDHGFCGSAWVTVEY